MKKIEHKFVDHVPDQIDEGILYISIPFETVIHKCCCGCGEEVVTPLSPAAWSITFDGERVSLSPSIGNWSFKCKSHYWIRKNKIEWAEKFSEDEIKYVQKGDVEANIRYYSEENHSAKPKKKSKKWYQLIIDLF